MSFLWDLGHYNRFIAVKGFEVEQAAATRDGLPTAAVGFAPPFIFVAEIPKLVFPVSQF